MKRPILLDHLVWMYGTKGDCTECEINGAWYIAKPLPYPAWWMVFERLAHAWLVLCGRAFAVQYAEDWCREPAPERNNRNAQAGATSCST
jgi:hypothetical protein